MDYEDELDRMRARKGRSGKNTVRRSGERTPERGQREKEVRAGRSYYNAGEGRNPRARYGGEPDRTKGAKQAEMKRKKKRKRRILMFELTVLAILVCAGAFLMLKQRTHQEGYWTIAIFGVDSRDGKLDKGALSDVEMLCNIDKATGEIKLVSVYRDTYLKINSKGTYHKINEAYFKGGHKQAVEALNENLDLKIDDYATFNWKAVADAINILGGVDIEITDAEFAYINGFITETVNSTGVGSYQLKSAGMNHLDGVQAVSYARLRLMDTDFNRTERQRKVIGLAMEKAKQADFATLSRLVTAVFPQISTSIGMDDVLSMAKGISKYHIGETAGFPFSRTTTKIGKMDCVIATTLESNVIQLHQFLYNETDYSPSLAVKKISAQISKESGISNPGKNAPSGGSTGGKSSNKKAPEETAKGQPETVPETIPEETIPVTEEETEESTKEITVETVPEETESPTNEDGSLIGPGADIKETKAEQEETAESQKETEKQEEKETAKETEKETKPSEAPEETKAQTLPDQTEGAAFGGPGEVGPGM